MKRSGLGRVFTGRTWASLAGVLVILVGAAAAQSRPGLNPAVPQDRGQHSGLNAIDAMPSGGKLRLTTKSVENGVEIDVADSGTGLTKEECERLFTPYYTTKQYGTGLGLAIVQSVVSDHGGDISVESGKESGTVFRIRMPKEAASS